MKVSMGVNELYRESDLTKAYYSTGEVAKLLGLTSKTIINYDKAGKLPFERGETDRRRLSKSNLMKYLEKRGLLLAEAAKKDAVYARVSTTRQKERGDLSRQVQTVLAYAATQRPNELLIYEEVGGGLNENRRELQKLLKLVLNKEVSRIFVNYKDRLSRFGYKYIEMLCAHSGCEIIVVSEETSEKSVQEELAEDLCSIIHSFSGRLYGLRGKRGEVICAQIKESAPESGGDADG
jgi:excisionase family DNA binding protein